MKRLVIVCLSVVLLGLVTAGAEADDVFWEIKKHSDQLETLKEEVTAMTNQGYVPMGITYDNRELYILYVKDPKFEMTAWYIVWYDSEEAFQKGITEEMENGNVPTGIAYPGKLFYVLYVKADSSADAWQLTPSSRDLVSVKKAIQPHISQSYIPVGIASLKGKLWTLLLRITDTTAERWRVETYEVGTQADNINAAIEKSYIPFGLDYDSEKGSITILYISFREKTSE